MAVHYETRDLVALITLDRPDVRNAVDSSTAQELHDAFLRFDADQSAHVAVFAGRHGTFCAGADLKALAAGDTRDLAPEARGPMGPTRMELDKPVIAAIEGHAVAGGLELALWCDLRVVAEDAVLGVFCRRFGVPLIDLGTVRLPRLVGHGRAMDLILTGRPVHAEEALRIGLCERIAAPGQALDVACELAAQIAAFPQRCLRGDRRAAIDQWSLSWDAAMRRELELGLATLASGETLAGASAFAKGQGRHGAFE